MAEPAKDQDQSMEDILQSIKRIIAEEGEPSPEVQGSDVLELTELLAEDGSITSAEPRPTVGTMSIDEIMAVPVSSMEPPAPAPAAVTPPPAPAPKVEPAAAAPTAEEGLLSNASLSASVAALNSLRDSMNVPTPRATDMSFRSGTTLEDLVLEGLKPMLKDWLDQNLPNLVEALVQKEISKLTRP